MKNVFSFAFLVIACWLLFAPASSAADEQADLILHNGKIITVDKGFSVMQAVAVKDGRFLRVGGNRNILKLKGAGTEVIDLAGKTVLPGLIDSHVHPGAASMTEFDHPIPDMETIEDVLAYVRSRAKALAKGEWIEVRQVFITRLKEQRYPTRSELDAAAPNHPVVFATGPDASLNSLALKLSGIDKDFKVTDGGAGFAEKDPATGEPTGILRDCTRYVKIQPSGRQPTEADRVERLHTLLKDYNSVGLTAIADRDASVEEIERYRRLNTHGKLPVRVAVSQHLETKGDLEQVCQSIRKIAKDPLRAKSSDLRLVGVKTYLDGGMLTGSAYMREPWGLSKIYSITDPSYRGLLFIPKDRLLAIVQETVENGLQFTAHSVGDGAVHALLDVYEEINSKTPIRTTRPCITHSNFMSREAVEQAARLGVVIDIQPAWLFLDTRTLAAQFGYDRLRYFQPLRSLFAAGAIVGGGSDHMQKIGSRRAINPYNPFLGMETAVTRRARRYEGALHEEEALTREQAIRFYTTNNAYLLYLEDQIGSIEPGKLADFIVVDTDLLTCPVQRIKETQCLLTCRNGKAIYKRPK